MIKVVIFSSLYNGMESASLRLGTCGTPGNGQQIRLSIKFWTVSLREAISCQCRSLQRLAIEETFQRCGYSCLHEVYEMKERN